MLSTLQHPPTSSGTGSDAAETVVWDADDYQRAVLTEETSRLPHPLPRLSRWMIYKIMMLTVTCQCELALGWSGLMALAAHFGYITIQGSF